MQHTIVKKKVMSDDKLFAQKPTNADGAVMGVPMGYGVELPPPLYGSPANAYYAPEVQQKSSGLVKYNFNAEQASQAPYTYPMQQPHPQYSPQQRPHGYAGGTINDYHLQPYPQRSANTFKNPLVELRNAVESGRSSLANVRDAARDSRSTGRKYVERFLLRNTHDRRDYSRRYWNDKD